MLTDGWWTHPLNTKYIGRLLDLARRERITVYWLLPPLVPALQTAREKRGLDGAYLTFVQGFVAQYPNLVVLDGHHSAYKPDAFTDAAHVNIRGGCSLSAGLGDLLARNAGQGNLPPNSRWLAIPPYRDYEPRAPIEDIYGSAYLLATGKSAKAQR
jgi:hypothetical protein